MKATFSFFFMMMVLSMQVALAGGGTANRVEPDRVEIKQEGRRVLLRYLQSTLKPVSVTILTEKGQVLFREQIKQAGAFERPYDFSALPAGNYLLEVKDAEGTLTTDVQLSAAAAPATTPKKPQSFVHIRALSTVRKGFGAYFQHVAAPLQLRILNNQGQVLYTERIVTTKASHYLLDQTIKGPLTIEVLDHEQVIYSLTK